MPDSPANFRTVLKGGTIVDGTGGAPRRADLAMCGNVIEAVGTFPILPTDVIVDVTGRMVMPGFIDAHSHADSAVFSREVQKSLLRQGVTTVIVGQDGVSYAPGDGRYASEYFGALNGSHPNYSGGGVAALLASYDETTAVNVGYLVPAGTVRYEVKGYSAAPSTPQEISGMTTLVKEGLTEGALGVSTGLDYVPNIHASTAELTELCRAVASVGGIYVTHMRGGYEANAGLGMDEVADIAVATGVSVHVSHYHGPSGLLVDLVERMTCRGIDVTFDAYPYRRGCTLLTMPLLPPELLSGSRSDVIARLQSPVDRQGLVNEWFPSLDDSPIMGPEWSDNLTLAHIAAIEYDWAHGMTVREAATQAGSDPANFALDVLLASKLEVNGVMKVRDQRPYEDLAVLFTHPAHLAGSDGIFVGKHSHPRAFGTFAKFLRMFTRERSDYDWPAAAQHLSGRAAERFCLGDRGRLWPGYVADVVVVDPTGVHDRATYGEPRKVADGIDDVFVAGIRVLADGELTGATPGRGLRRSTLTK